MIESEQSILIDAHIDGVWSYVQDIRGWANLFPGCANCVVDNERDSRWIIKVGAGGLVRTVNVLVHVDRWDAPECVNFSFKLDGDPVEGGGSYFAARKGPQATEITLKVRVAGTGPLAPMWEAMSRPLLPQLAKSFAAKLKTEIEGSAGAPSPRDSVVTQVPSLFAAVGKRPRNVWRATFGSITRCLKPTHERTP